MHASKLSRRGVAARREYIISQVELAGEVDVTAVAEVLGVSPMTVRRDLSQLDAEGLIRRIHGGATQRAFPALRSATLVEEKSSIARAVGDLIGKNETVGLDVGSTCTAIAGVLADRSDVSAITNSVHAALAFQSSLSSLLLLGGKINAEGAMIGGAAFADTNRVFLDKLVLGCGGLSSSAGITYHNWEENVIRRHLLSSASQVILATDHTKFDHVRPYHLCDLEMVDVLVTDQMPPTPLNDKLVEAGVNIILA